MENMVNVESIVADILLIGIGVLALVLLFSFVNLIVALVFRELKVLPVLKRFSQRLETIRQNIKWMLVFICSLLILGTVAFGGYLMYLDKDLLGYSQKMVLSIPLSVWVEFGLDLVRIIGVVVLATISVRLIRGILSRLDAKAKAFEGIHANDESIEYFFNSLYRILSNGIWLLVFVFTVWSLPHLSFLSQYIFLIFKIYIIISLGMLVVSSIAVVVDSLDALSRKYSSPDNILSYYSHLSGLVPIFRRSLEYIIYVYVATLVIMQIKFISALAAYGPVIIQIISIIFLSRVFVVVSDLIIEKSLGGSQRASAVERQRQKTLLPLVKSFLKYAIYFIAFILVLRAMNINPSAILAGAGIVGIVVGLGAQPLINDLVSGFFILFENIYLVDDWIETETARGKVEGIDIRTTRIRDPNGQLHILRNGQLNKVINYSKTYTHAVVEVGVAYDSNLDHVYDVLARAGLRLKEQDANVLEATQVQGLEDFGESELLIRTTTRVKPGQHLEVARRYRKMIKEAFDKAGIEIPFARRVVIFKNAPPLKDT
ncbi:mechanosensitive ion channel family protein [Candidatus Margulisiibacteriota bacterium]